MKTTYRFILAAFTTMAMVSCTKDIAADREGTDPQDGVRTIAISFDTPTKTFLGGPDGLTPQFKGDGSEEIIVSNGNRWQKLTVQKDGNGAYITTELSGNLVAVYPSSAAKLNGTVIEGVKVPAIQTGRFADANIAMANIDEDAKSATFHNKTAILRFYVDRSVDVRFISLSSEKSPITRETVNIDDETIMKNTILVMAEIPEDLGEVLESPEAITSMKPLYQTTDDPDKRICYVSVLPFSEGEFYVKGITSSQEQGRTYSNVTLKERDIADAFIPYYINVRVGGTDDAPEYQRWSYCNLGAFLPEEPGEYFMWGEIKGHKADFDKATGSSSDMVYIVDAFTSDFSNFSEIAKTDVRYSSNWNSSDCFKYSNAPYAGEPDYTKYTGSDYETLQPEDDAASVNWGGKWRMPTEGEYEALLLAEKTYESSEKSGLLFQGEEDNQLFFPAVGGGEEKNLVVSLFNNHIGYYWSSTINASNADHALALIFFCEAGEGSLDDAMDRDMGFPIRPIYGAPAEPEVDPTFIQVQEFEDQGNI